MRIKIQNYSGRNFKKERTSDKISKEYRSLVMSKIRSSGTKFEENFILNLKNKIKYKYLLNVSQIRGKPDIVFMKSRICVFLDSDFWHGWQYPRWKHLLKDDFWRNKIERNRKRDKKITAYLRKHDWIVLRVWEHSIKKDSTFQLNRITEIFKKNN